MSDTHFYRILFPIKIYIAVSNMYFVLITFSYYLVHFRLFCDYEEEALYYLDIPSQSFR